MIARVLVLVALITLALIACETTQKRIERNYAYFRSLPAVHQNLIRQGRIKVGFTTEEVYIAWGRPSHKALTESSRGRMETWIYTRTRTQTYYEPIRWYDRKTDTWRYIDEPRYLYREYIAKDVVFLKGRVNAWTVYPKSIPYNAYRY